MIRHGVHRLFNLALRRRDQWEREVEDEIKLHLALRAEQLASQGLSPNAASDEAIRRFGPLSTSRARLVEAARHRERSMQRTEFLADLKQDLAFALRTLGRQKGWTAVTIATLALGIGATTAVFSVVSTLMLHPLPYPHGDRMVFVYQEPTAGNKTGLQLTISPATEAVRAWMQGSHSFDAFQGYETRTVSLATTEAPATSHAAAVFPSFPAFADVQPILGRMFTSRDIATHARGILLGEQFWRSRYGAQPNAIGASVTLNDTVYTIIGVLPASLRPPVVSDPPPDFWMPLDISQYDADLKLIGRLRPGVSTTAAARELDSLGARASVAGSSAPASDALAFKTVLANPADRVPFRDSLAMLAGAVFVVLLVACANVAHLLLARTAARHRELALRAALGARRGRLCRQLLTESLLLTVSGAALGITLGAVGLRALVAMRPESLAALRVAHLDGTTLGVAAGITALSGLVFGVMGAMQSAADMTKRSVRSGPASSPGRRSERVRGALVVTEMALSALLVVGATMLVRSVSKMQNADLGYQPRGLYSLRLELPAARYATPVSRMEFLAELTQQLAQLGTLRAVTVAADAPHSMSFQVGRLEVEGEAAPPSSATSFVATNAVQPNYFAAMGIRLTQGTSFTDTAAVAHQIIVNQGFARRHWGSASALGRRLRVTDTGDTPWSTVVGVAADAQTLGPMLENAAPMIYAPMNGALVKSVPAVLVRTAGPSSPIARVRSLVRGIDPRVAVTVRSELEVAAGAIATPRYVMLMLSVFTVLALLLAAIGLYGVMSYAVAQRTHDIGIRIALGAPRSTVARSVIWRGITLAIVGAGLGLVAAHWGTRLIQHELFGVEQSDPLSLAAAVIVLLGAAVVACVVPTRRALRVDPITAIRAE